jgi:predicted nuclease of predicted toxin-antitoxin system
MRILIDECLNWRLSRAFTGHYAISAQKMGWSGIKNGELLALAVENGFDVFLTGDRNLMFQQNTTEFSITIVVLEAKGIQLHHTLPLIPRVIALLPTLKPGIVVRVQTKSTA